MLVIYYVEDNAKMAKFNGADAFLRKAQQKGYEALRASDTVIVIDRNFRTDDGVSFDEAYSLVSSMKDSKMAAATPSVQFKSLEWWKENVERVLTKNSLDYPVEDILWEMDMYFLGVDDLDDTLIDGAIYSAIYDYEESLQQKGELSEC